VAYVQVNNASHALKLAAFIVAFFSPFFSQADIFSDGTVQTYTPKFTPKSTISCSWSGSVPLGEVTVDGINLSAHALSSACVDLAVEFNSEKADFNRCEVPSVVVNDSGSGNVFINVTYKYSSRGTKCDYQGNDFGWAGGGLISESESPECPPEAFPLAVATTNVSGEMKCYNPDDVPAEDKEKENECKSLVLDSGNNTASDMCYTSASGSKSCNVQKVTTDGGGSYYKGVSAAAGGCVSSEHPPYDDAGTGDKKDGCIYSEGTNYCAANRDKHCSTTVGVEICDDGCIDDGTNLYCDTSKHPDVGEGDSNYFDDKGTCSVISASSSRGFCEDNDGEWDETSDYQETSCPAGAGTCSVAVAGLCASCFDAGGTWTPDPSALLSDEAKVGIENQALAKTGNDKLTQIEHGQRKTAEATQSTIKSGNAKVVAAIESLGEKLTEDKEKESFTTTTSTIDKSKISSLFDATATATLSAEIETLKTDITTSINSIRAEASSMMSITVPSTTGYEARNLTLTQGTFDMSLGRFSDFFKALAMPVMLICSILAGFILLGGKN
jgi:hypothetical protein